MKSVCEFCHKVLGAKKQPTGKRWTRSMKGYSHCWCTKCKEGVDYYGYDKWVDMTEHLRKRGRKPDGQNGKS